MGCLKSAIHFVRLKIPFGIGIELFRYNTIFGNLKIMFRIGSLIQDSPPDSSQFIENAAADFDRCCHEIRIHDPICT